MKKIIATILALLAFAPVAFASGGKDLSSLRNSGSRQQSHTKSQHTRN